MNYPELKKAVNKFFQKLFQINDTPQKISLGAGLGVFFGIMPGMGPVAALFLAHILKVNRAAALLGSLLTNTWISLVTFFLSIKIGAAVFNLSWKEAYDNSVFFIKNFHFYKLFSYEFIKILLPLLAGYIIVGLFFGLLIYLASLSIITILRKRKPAF